MARAPKREKHTLVYRRGEWDPKEWLNFVELDSFAPAWKRLGLGDDDLRALQITICAKPDVGPVVSNTGGLRKIRFAPAAWNRGLSGAARVYYAYFPEYGLVALIYAHSKKELESITSAQKATIKQLLSEIQTYLEGR